MSWKKNLQEYSCACPPPLFGPNPTWIRPVSRIFTHPFAYYAAVTRETRQEKKSKQKTSKFRAYPLETYSQPNQILLRMGFQVVESDRLDGLWRPRILRMGFHRVEKRSDRIVWWLSWIPWCRLQQDLQSYLREKHLWDLTKILKRASATAQTEVPNRNMSKSLVKVQLTVHSQWRACSGQGVEKRADRRYACFCCKWPFLP